MLIGQNVGPFLVEKELGCGAMGTVYLAVYNKTGRKVALKVISPGLSDNEKLMERFDREVNILKQLKHPNIVRLLASGRFHGSPFYAMELIDGDSLDLLLRKRGRFSWEEVVDIGKQTALALQCAHEQGVIHRDLKPSNLMWDKASNSIKLTDFGIAKDVDRTSITTEHKTIGTIAYMSPEQCQGLRTLTGKSDLYALGIVMYELVTGKKPFEAENAMDMFLMHVQGKFERPSRLVPDIPMWLDTLICQCMEKKPDHRPMDGAMVAKALDEVKEKVASQESFSVKSARKTVKRSKDSRDREAAEALLNATGKTTRKRRKPEPTDVPDSGRTAQVLKAVGLAAVLMAIIGLLVWGLWPASSAEHLAIGERLVQEADRLVDQNDLDGAQMRWIDARASLNRAAGGNDKEVADKAEQLLAHVTAGDLYRRGLQKLKADRTKWPDVNKDYWDKLFDKYPPDNKYVVLARKEMEQHEAKPLWEEALKAADPNDEEKWPEARQKVERITRRYPNSPFAEKAESLADRLSVHQRLLIALRAEKTKEYFDKPTDLDEHNAFGLALDALRLEDQKKEARKAWELLKDFGDKEKVVGRPYKGEKLVRPYYDLALAKLSAK